MCMGVLLVIFWGSLPMDQGDHITYKFQTVHPHHFNCTKCRWVTECVCVCVCMCVCLPYLVILICAYFANKILASKYCFCFEQILSVFGDVSDIWFKYY